jgi:hypothetical protein
LQKSGNGQFRKAVTFDGGPFGKVQNVPVS